MIRSLRHLATIIAVIALGTAYAQTPGPVETNCRTTEAWRSEAEAKLNRAFAELLGR